MEQNTHGGVVVGLIVVIVLDSTGLSKHNGILSLQMGGVGNQRQLHPLTGGSRTLKVHTQVVLDITGALVGRLGGASELTEDGLVGLADNVGQNIETTTVRHTNDDVLDAVVDTAVNQGLHTRDQGLATLKTETLVIRELGGEERLEARTPDQTVEDAALIVNGIVVRLGDLEAITDPLAGLAVRNMNVLHTIRTAVDLLAGVDDLAQSHLLAAINGETGQNTGSKSELLVQVTLGETVVVELELLGLVVAKGLGLSADTERVNLSLVVTTGLVSAHQQLNLQVIRHVSTSGETLTRHTLRDTSGRGRDEGGGRSERLGDGHVTLFHVLEISLPRDVDTGRVILPCQVHLIDVVGGVAREEGIVGVLSA
jgi:hypothetical protein